MDRSFFRIMFVRSHAEGAARNQDHSDLPGMLACLSVGGMGFELNRAHSAIPQKVGSPSEKQRTGRARSVGLRILLFAAAAGAPLDHLKRLLDAQRSAHLTRWIF